jgi:serine/threonine-protein kinase
MTTTEEATATNLHEGLLVAEKYRLVEPAGEGAMGSVWKAIHTSLGHTVAIKFLHGAVANAAEPRARFEREAKLAARLGDASRHIARVTDHGVTPEGTPFLVMEYLQGEGLEVRLKRERRLPVGLVSTITSHLARALHVAHSSGVIHRDLKPANVFLCQSDEEGLVVKLLDFGVAKATLESDENQATRAGALIGTPNYMSPEQITGEGAVDHRSDLWALGAIVYRMAVGRAPFGSGSLNELAMRIVSTEPPTPTAIAPDLPTEFDLWVRHALAKSPEQRFQSAKELADSLAMVAGVSAAGVTGAFSSTAAEHLAMQLAALQTGDSVAGLQATLGHAAATQSVPPRAARRRGGAGFVALVSLVATLGAVGFIVATRAYGNATTAANEVVEPATSIAAASTPSAVATEPTTSAAIAASTEPTLGEDPKIEPTTPAATSATTPTIRAGLGRPSGPTRPAGVVRPAVSNEPEITPPPPPPAATPPPGPKPETWKKWDDM